MDKPQFDVSLGGFVHLAHDVEVNKLISARASEISAMTNSIDNPQRTKLVFQKLPMHMRRRVMSHNAKRMPRRLREAHLNQMEKSGLPPKTKRPSRKYRRRPQNLLLEYNRRQRSKVWLETHIWHAKRFHMCDKWGFKIAEFSNDRGFRANYRAVAKHCLIQDISYYSCLELIGPGPLLTATLRTHCKSQLTFGAKLYMSCSREGSLMFYGEDSRPIGVVNFFWKPEEEQRTLWMWVHPAVVNQVVHELIKSFRFEEIDRKLINKETNCRMNLLKDLNRFRVRGPLTVAVLSEALKLPQFPANFAESSEQQGCLTSTAVDIDQTESESIDSSWNKGWYADAANLVCFEAQKNFFENIKTMVSPGQMPRGAVMGLTVLDPRFYLPGKRQKAVLGFDELKAVFQIPENLSKSPLWEANIRENIKANFPTSGEINKLRSGNLVPGVENDVYMEEKLMSKVPIILVQCPGGDNEGKSIGFSSGVDIILPSGWALPFWMGLTLRCARPIGIRDYQSLLFESLQLNSSEIHPPDTAAYLTEAAELKHNLIETYFLRPPNRRINYTKFSITSPFSCEWKLLIKEWTNSDSVNVLRNRQDLETLDSILKGFSGDKRNRKKPSREKSSVNVLDDSIDESALVGVKLKILGRGKPKKFAQICIPMEKDLKGARGPMETLKPDPNEKIRKQVNKNHHDFLKRLMRKRKRARKEKKAGNFESTAAVEAHSKKMRKLWLPECNDVRNSCDREVMGWVVHGDFAFSEACGVGWGYVVLKSLKKLIDRKTDTILVRNVQSRLYRRARIEIVK